MLAIRKTKELKKGKGATAAKSQGPSMVRVLKKDSKHDMVKAERLKDLITAGEVVAVL